jgi:hypothetical protein
MPPKICETGIYFLPQVCVYLSSNSICIAAVCSMFKTEILSILSSHLDTQMTVCIYVRIGIKVIQYFMFNSCIPSGKIASSHHLRTYFHHFLYSLSRYLTLFKSKCYLIQNSYYLANKMHSKTIEQYFCFIQNV